MHEGLRSSLSCSRRRPHGRAGEGVPPALDAGLPRHRHRRRPACPGLAEESEQTERLAEFGVVFLMFSIGLEFSLPRLVAMRWQVFGLGGAQVAATVLATLLIGLTGGIPWQGGLALGAAYAMSSTAIVGRLLAEKLDLHSASGRRTMSVLLFQDLMVVFMLILIPALADTSRLAAALGTALAQTRGRPAAGDRRRAAAHPLVVRPRRAAQVRRAVHAQRAVDHHRAGLPHRMGRPVADAGRLPRRHAHLRDDVPPPGRGGHPPLPRRAARPVLHHHRRPARPGHRLAAHRVGGAGAARAGGRQGPARC
jgi:hypothetical protein